jgi:hypothetical protein
MTKVPLNNAIYKLMAITSLLGFILYAYSFLSPNVLSMFARQTSMLGNTLPILLFLISTILFFKKNKIALLSNLIILIVIVSKIFLLTSFLHYQHSEASLYEPLSRLYEFSSPLLQLKLLCTLFSIFFTGELILIIPYVKHHKQKQKWYET